MMGTANGNFRRDCDLCWRSFAVNGSGRRWRLSRGLHERRMLQLTDRAAVACLAFVKVRKHREADKQSDGCKGDKPPENQGARRL